MHVSSVVRSLKVFVPLFNQIIYFFIVVFKIYIQFFIRGVFYKYFLLVYNLSSHPHATILCREEVFNFMKSRLWISSFDRIWCCKQASPYPRSLRFSPMLSSKIFLVLCLTFRSVIHFELTYNIYKVCVWVYFFAWRNPVPLVEQTIFAPLYSPSYFVKDQLTIGIYFCILYFVILSTCLFCSPTIVFLVNLKIRYCQSSNFVLLFQYWLGYWLFWVVTAHI